MSLKNVIYLLVTQQATLVAPFVVSAWTWSSRWRHVLSYWRIGYGSWRRGLGIESTCITSEVTSSRTSTIVSPITATVTTSIPTASAEGALVRPGSLATFLLTLLGTGKSGPKFFVILLTIR